MRVELEQLSSAVAAVTWAPLDDVAARIEAVATTTAAETGKQVMIVSDFHGFRLPDQARQALAEVLVHAIRNAIDHGIESAADRAAAEKPPVGRIAVQLDVDQHRVLIEVSDDGGGVDLDRVRQRALERGLITDPDITPSALLELVFEPGFSTASALTSVSGRGVGMDAIRAMAEARGGTAELRTAAGHGTLLLVELGLSDLTDRG